jgi:hypothetical protein
VSDHHYGLMVGDRIRCGSDEGVVELLSRLDSNLVYIRTDSGALVPVVAEWSQRVVSLVVTPPIPTDLIASALQANYGMRLTFDGRWMVYDTGMGDTDNSAWEVYAAHRGGRGLRVIRTDCLSEALRCLIGDNDHEGDINEGGDDDKEQG